MEKRASVTNLNWFEWSLFTLVVFLRCQALRKSSYDLICSESRQATTIFLQFFVKKNVKNRLSASTTRGSIANIISYWYRLKENFIGFPTKKTACKSNKNSLQAWPIHQGMYMHFPHFCHFYYGCLIFCHCWCKVLVGPKSQEKAFLTWMHQIILPFHSVNEN